MKMRNLFLASFAFVASVATAAVTKSPGSAQSLAVSIGTAKSTTVALVNEYFKEEYGGYEFNTGAGVYWAKFTAKKNKSYTIWIEGDKVAPWSEEAERKGIYINSLEPMISLDIGGGITTGGDGLDLDLDIGSGTDIDFPTSANAYFQPEKSGSQERWVMYSWSWWSEDPSSETYYIEIRGGEIGDKVTIRMSEGVDLASGLFNRPENLTFAETVKQTGEREISAETEWEYFFNAAMKKDRKYLIGVKGVAGAPETRICRLGGGTEKPYEPWAGKYDQAVCFTPAKDNDYYFSVSGAVSTANFKFTLDYMVIGARTIAQHKPVAKTAGAEFDITPGRINDKTLDPPANDDIIDNNIFSFAAVKGKRYAFYTDGATAKTMIRLYDSAGKMISESIDREGALDSRLAFACTTAGTYYFGVAERLKDDEEDPLTGAPCKVGFIEVNGIDGEPDEWDAGDDTYAGASGLSPIPSVEPSSQEESTWPAVVDRPGHGPHRLGITDWEDVFVIGARKGVAYAVSAVLADEGVTPGLELQFEVFTVNSKGAETKVEIESGDGSKSTPIKFVPTSNAPYYVRISVKDGKAHDYPAYTVHATAYSTTPGAELGILTVNTYGAPGAQWYLDGETTTLYPGGSSVLLDSAAHKVTFKKVTNFTEPGKIENIHVTPGAVPTVYDAFYTDTKDPYDNQSSGTGYEIVSGVRKLVTYSPTAWTLKNTDTTYDRTLWDDDPADIFSFAGTDGYFYDFALPTVTGDAVFSITNAVGGTIVEGVKSVSKLPLPKTGSSKYYLIVAHGKEIPTNGSYRISGKYANVGNVKLSTTALSVNENTAKATFTVSRTAKDGRVRVKYGTVADTAKPGSEYIAQNGILEWADGDSKAKTIDIKLVPDLIPTYEGGNKQFAVKFIPIPDDEMQKDEYKATFPITTKTTGKVASAVTTVTTNDTVTITLKEVTKAVPGTIQMAGCENPKKPVVTIVAGETQEIALERITGIDGLVGVSVASVKGTANKNGETDFEPIGIPAITWADGESGESEKITIVTKKTDGDFTGTKTFTLKLTALTSKSGDPVQYAKPTLAAASITVNIVNDKYEENVTDFAKTLPKADGVAMKEAKEDSWFRENGAQGEEFYSVVSRKFTGPSRLWWGPSWDPFRTNLFVSAKGETVVMRSEDVYTNDLLQAATAAAPTVDKAVVAAGPVKLAFGNLPDDEAREIGYRVYVLSAGDKVLRPGAKSAVALKLGDPETEILPPYETNVAYTTTNKGKYTWRVDSFFTGGTVTNTAKSAWSFTVLKPEETAAALVVDGLADGVTADLNLGVPVEYAIHTHDDAKAKVAVVSGTGSLPGTKLKLEQDKTTKAWFLRGYADKAGDFQCAIQATSSSPALKSPTYVLKFHVAALPDTKTIVPLAPCVNKAVIEPCEGTNVSFKAEAGVSYRAFFLEKGQKSAADPKKALKLGDAETERMVTVTGDVASFWSEMAIGTKTNYTWMVYAYYEGGAVTNKSSTFSFDGAPLDADGRSYATNLRGHDAYGTPFAEGTPMVLRQRLPVEGDDVFEFDGEKLKSVAIASGTGSLPTGLKLDQDKGTTKAPGTMKWRIHGTPTKAGTFQLAVQATYTNYVAKTSGSRTTYTAVETKAATRVITFVVEAVDAPADLSFTLAGPGRFVYTATDARIPLGQPGKTATKTNFIAKASETLKLSDVERLHSYDYVKLPTPVALPPLMDKAVVASNTVVTLLFTTNAATDAANAIAYRVYVLSAGDKVVRQAGKPAVALKLGDPETEILPPYETNAVWTSTSKGKYTWRVDSYFVDGPVTNVQKTAWSFSAADGSKLPAGETLPDTMLVGTDVFGRNVGGAGKAGLGDNGEIALKQLVKVDLAVGAPGSTVKTVAGKLPTGVSLKAVKNADGKNQYFLTGTPGKEGEYPLVLQETGSFKNGSRSSVSVAGSTTAFTLVVAASDLAIGTFEGILQEDGQSLTNGFPTLGTISLSVTSAGKLSAKLKIAGTDYTVTGTGFDRLEFEDLTAPGFTHRMSAVLPFVKKVGTVTYTNALEVIVKDGASTNLVALGELAGSARLTMAVPDSDSKGAQEGIAYVCDLHRDNSKIAAYKAAFAAFEGYYTVALPIVNPEPGKPQGNGYLTLTVKNTGAATVGGSLADGTSVSCSRVPALLGDLTKPETCLLVVPVFTASKPNVFGGDLVLYADLKDIQGNVSMVVYSGNVLRWCNDNAALTYYGDEGWKYEIEPAGGWYDKVVNLQTYYLSGAFEVETPGTDALPYELLSDGYDFVPSTMPNGLPLELFGDTLSVPKQTLVKDPATKLYDFDLCTNASNVKISFVRSTGLVSGSFEVWTEGTNAKGAVVQSKKTGFSHKGVLVINRHVDSSLPLNVWSAGYLLTPSMTLKNTVNPKTMKPVSRSYKASLPFNIIVEDQGEIDPWEKDWGSED